MTTYNTGNPIGSTDARDLYDNAQNLDNFANGTAASYTDRRGVSRRSLSGIDAAADNVLNGIGYAVPVAYASGISLTLTSQTVDYNGVIYAPKSSALPFTTSSWVADSAKFRAIQVTDADLITYTPAGTGAVATTVQTALRDAEADIAALESLTDPLSYPLSSDNAHIHPVVLDFASNYGLNANLFTRTDGGITIVSRKSAVHENNINAFIVAYETYDNGLTRTNERIAYFGQTTDDRNMASANMGSRFGLMAMRNDGGVVAPAFIYSDDQGATWHGIALTLDPGLPVGYASSPHGKIYRWPASAGGNDTTGWIVYFYSQSVIAYATTTNNGNTWSAVTPCIDGTGLDPTEMVVFRVGTENKWVMLARRESGSEYALCATSTNMTTWTTFSASGVLLGRNPPASIEDGGSVYLYTSNRRGIGPTSLPMNAMLVSKIDPSAFYNSVGVSGFGAWETVAQLPQWATGYFDFIQKDGGWLGIFTAGELVGSGWTTGNGGGANALYMIDSKPAAQGMAVLQGAAQHQALNTNGAFQVWQNGASGVGTTSRVLTADGWGLRRNASATGFEWSRQAGSSGGYSLRIQRTSGNTQLNPINAISVINSDDVRYMRGQQCNIALRMKRGADFSAASSMVQVVVYSNTAESKITSTDGTVPSSTALVSFNAYLNANGLWLEFDAPFYVPTDAAMVWIRLYITPVGTAGDADFFEVEQVRIVPTPYKQPINPRTYREELARCQYYFCKTYAADVAIGTITDGGSLQQRARGTEASGAVYLQWRYPVEMRESPALTIYSPGTGTAGFMRNNSAGTDLAASATANSASGVQIINNAATTSGSVYTAHAVASALPW